MVEGFVTHDGLVAVVQYVNSDEDNPIDEFHHHGVQTIITDYLDGGDSFFSIAEGVVVVFSCCRLPSSEQMVTFGPHLRLPLPTLASPAVIFPFAILLSTAIHS